MQLNETSDSDSDNDIFPNNCKTKVITAPVKIRECDWLCNCEFYWMHLISYTIEAVQSNGDNVSMQPDLELIQNNSFRNALKLLNMACTWDCWWTHNATAYFHKSSH